MPPTPRRSVAQIAADERAEQLRIAFEDGLLIDLRNTGEDRDSSSARRAAQKIFSDRAIERLAAVTKELDELKAAVQDTTEVTTLQEQNAALTAELEKFKANLNAVLAEENKKSQSAVSAERLALQQREISIKRKEEAMAISTDAALTLQAFQRFHRMVKHLPMGEFFDHESGNPNSPWYWAAWMPMEQAKDWTAWESAMMKLPRERQLFEIAQGLHVIACIHHQREKIDRSPERKTFLEARLAYLGTDAQNEVFGMIRDFSAQCMREAHPMPSHANIDEAYMQNQRQRILLGEVPSVDGGLLPEWIA
jgi:hypothetical protein